MKLKLTLASVILCILSGILVLSTGCSGTSGSDASALAQTVTVQRGSISILVTGTGNLALKNKQALSFGQTGLVSQAANAKISEVLVSEGQTVDRGQVLVKADTKDWQDQITTGQHNLDSANFSLSQAKTGVIQAQAALLKAQNDAAQSQVNISRAQNDVAGAQSALETARYNLSMQSDVKELQDKIDNANIQLQQAQLMLKEASSRQDTGSTQYWQEMIGYYSVDTNSSSTNPAHKSDGGVIGVYTQKIQYLVADPAHAGVTSSVADINARVAAVQQAEANLPIVQNSVLAAQYNVVYAQNAVVNAQNSLDTAQYNVVIARNNVDDVQRSLDDSKNSSQEITAPFKGLITRVDVTGGSIVQRSAALIEIAEPDIFEANVMVTQRDVVSIKVGHDSIVAVDALPGLNYPARITRIAPLATIQQGVVNYQITVELTSTQPETAAGSSAAGTPQVDLKDGFSVVASIPVRRKDNILIVPAKAVSHQGQDYVVQVETADAAQTRTVKVGISDFQNTEILEGLSEGERVVLPEIPTAAPSGSGGMFGGM